MSDQNEGSFLDVDLDWSTETLTSDEARNLLAWYSAAHVRDGVELSRMPTFLIEHNPAGFKQYRRFIREIDRACNGVALPDAAHLLLFLYTYAALGYERGILYCTISARQLGASVGEALDTLRLAAVAAGPLGLDAAGGITEYLRDWRSEGDGRGLDWPEGWAPRPDAFSTGLDLGSPELAPAELARIEEWCRSFYGEVNVKTLATLHPTAFKAQRARFETSLGDTLPVQMAPLCMLHLAAVRQWQKPTLRAAQLARGLGVERGPVVSTLFWAAMYGGDIVTESAIETLAPLLEAWD
jgi:hypothetical protein